MTGAVTRKIEIAQQIAELLETMKTPPQGETQKLAGERQARRQAMLATLQFISQHEHLFKAWLGARKGGGLRFRVIRGQFSVGTASDQWIPLEADEANVALERFDEPVTLGQEEAANVD